MLELLVSLIIQSSYQDEHEIAWNVSDPYICELVLNNKENEK